MLSLSLMLLGWIFTFTPPFQKFVTFLHEFGHYLHLMLVIRKYNLSMPNPVIHVCPKPVSIYLIPQYQGKTFSTAYTYLEQNELAIDIVLNALAGFLFCIATTLLPAILLVCFLMIDLALGYLFGMLPSLILQISNFIHSSDWKYIWHPERFQYISICTKCGYHHP